MRNTSNLERNHKCPDEGCEKLYASKNALRVHIKSKHNDGNKTNSDVTAAVNAPEVPTKVDLFED